MTAVNLAGGAARCLHCGLPAQDGDAFCCAGCHAVHDLLAARDLTRYYDLRRGPGVPVAAQAAGADLAWIDAALPDGDASPVRRVRVDVQGIHCSGCVWLIEELFQRQPGAIALDLNPARGQAALSIAPSFPLRDFVVDLERFGYRLGPALKAAERPSDALLIRAVIGLVLAGNGMMLALAVYLGLASGAVHRWFTAVEYGIACASVVVGMPVFARGALRGLRAGLLHLDLPITLGIALAFAGSTWAFATGDDRAFYVDTLAVFVALMLLGRWLQGRVIDANRDRLLASGGAEGLLVRRVERGAPVVVPCSEIAPGDILLVAVGDLVPVDAELIGAPALLSLDWIRGESEPQRFDAGAPVPAGCFNAGPSPVEVRALEPFSVSRIANLLRPSARIDAGGVEAGAAARRLTRWFVPAVLLAAWAGGAGWYVATGDLSRALVVATSVLVITCPCAFGVAAPLATEIALAGLARVGLFVRNPGFLDRAARVRRVVLDKTGTLTTGRVVLEDPARLAALTAADRSALHELAARSSHPASQAVRAAVGPVVLRSGVVVTETRGAGLAAVIDGRTYRLGARSFVTCCDDGARDARLAFGVDGAVLLDLTLADPLRPAAAADLRALEALGCEVHLLSGDAPERVAAAASAAGIPASRTVAGATPEDKAAWLAAHDAGDILFVGDGVNDALAARAAACSGTPAIDRPFMASLSDFYIVTPGLGPIRTALTGARAVDRVLRRNFAFAIAYNALGVGLAWAGLMSPWLAAALMPASSIAVVLLTISGLRQPWRS